MKKILKALLVVLLVGLISISLFGDEWADPTEQNIYSTSSGNVGIGTTAPWYPLVVKKNGSDHISWRNSYFELGRMGYENGNNNGKLMLFASGWVNVKLSSWGNSYFNGGRLGIYETSPEGLLEISANGGGEDFLLLSSNDNNNGDRFIVKNNGNVGIGIVNPTAKLHVYDNISNQVIVLLESDSQAWEIAVGGTGNASVNEKLYFWDRNTNTYGLVIDKNGNVGIGTTDPGEYKLAVNGTIHTKKVKVDQENWSDYVLKDDYNLRSLDEVEKFIKKNGHLPDIPSESEVKTNGIDLGGMNAKLLQKIEELTLYMIDLKKDNEELKKQVNKLSAIVK